MKKLFTLIAVLFVGCLFAQERPIMYGFSKMTFRVNSFAYAQEYYGDFLGFDRAFEYESINGRAVVYKINDRQFLEFVEDTDIAEKGSCISTTIQTPDVEGMHAYIASKGVQVTDVVVDGAGNKVFTAKDERDMTVEFADMNANTLFAKTKGKFLSERRISNHLQHVGWHINQVDEQSPFWCDVLGFKQFLRAPEDKSQPVLLLYMSMPGSAECIEFLNRTPTAPMGRNFEHPCFVVPDMQLMIDELRTRRPELFYRPTVGRTNRWLMSLVTDDGTKIEFTEAGRAR